MDLLCISIFYQCNLHSQLCLAKNNKNNNNILDPEPLCIIRNIWQSMIVPFGIFISNYITIYFSFIFEILLHISK